MRVRGLRECRDCGTRWSYYETASVECPACGSLRSRGLDDDRRLHTDDADAELDLPAARETAVEASAVEGAVEARDPAREYVRRRGFVRGGRLLALDDRYLAAAELAEAADDFARGADVGRPGTGLAAGRRTGTGPDTGTAGGGGTAGGDGTAGGPGSGAATGDGGPAGGPGDAERSYLLTLLRADAGDRPGPDAVPGSMRAARGLAAADAVDRYLEDVRSYLDDRDRPAPAVRSVAQRLDAHVRRVRALSGDVPPREADRLVAVARDVGRALGAADPDGGGGDGTTAGDADDGKDDHDPGTADVGTGAGADAAAAADATGDPDGGGGDGDGGGRDGDPESALALARRRLDELDGTAGADEG